MTTGNAPRSSEELREVIKKTASELFDEHGVEFVSMHQIAKKAGIGQGTLYRRYGNKADLCMEMMHGNFNELLRRVREIVEEKQHEPVSSRLKQVVDIMVYFLDKKLQWLGVIHTQNTPALNKEDFLKSQPYREMHGLLQKLLMSATNDELAHPINAEFTAHAYISMLSPHMYSHLICERGYTSQQVADNFYQSVVAPLFAAKD
jgi:AcrR family transcriptional regulator